jgi:hypothetical protein
MSRFVAQATETLLTIMAAIDAGGPPLTMRTALELLPRTILQPFPAPLGDA